MSLDPALRQIIASFKKSPHWDAALDLRLLRALWPALVGSSLAESTSIDSIDGSRVVIRVPDPTWEDQLLTIRGTLLQKLNEPWPHRWVREIGFVHENQHG